jgi:rSAM/selenodomain-associated transferase 1
MNGQGCLILFVKAPVPGEVKTRLAQALGKDRTFELYRRMLRRQIALVNSMTGVTRQLWVSGDVSHADFLHFDGPVFQQEGDDIGERMCHALQQALREFPSAILIGCDCPGIDSAYLGQAFTALENDFDAVLGPAVDGGYILIGLRSCDKTLFSDVDWGSGQVLTQTRVRLAGAGMQWRELDALDDIDEAADLEKLAPLVKREYGL